MMVQRDRPATGSVAGAPIAMAKFEAERDTHRTLLLAATRICERKSLYVLVQDWKKPADDNKGRASAGSPDRLGGGGQRQSADQKRREPGKVPAVEIIL